MTALENKAVKAVAHTGVTVLDMERALNFYTQGLGLHCVNRRRVDSEFIKRVVEVPGVDSIEVAYLALPDGRVVLELLQYYGCERQRVAQRPCDPGCAHLCLLVDDIGKLWVQALSSGGTARSHGPVKITNGPYADGYSGYLADSDGHFIELLEPPKAAPGQEFLGTAVLS